MAYTWIDSGALPSNKKVYDKRVSFRPYGFAEVRTVSRSRLPAHQMLAFLAEGIKVEGKDNDPLDLTLSDFLYVATLRLFVTLGSESGYRFTSTCVCGAPLSHQFTPEDIEFNDLCVDFPLKETLSGVEYSISPVTARQYVEQQPDDEFDMLAIAMGTDVEAIKQEEDVFMMEAIDDSLFHSLKPLHIDCSECKADVAVNIQLLGKDGSSSLAIPFH